MKNKYGLDRPNPKSLYYHSPQNLAKLEQEALRRYPNVRDKLQAYINEYRAKEKAKIHEFMANGHLEKVIPMTFEDQK